MHTIKKTDFKNIIGTSYHSWIIRGSKKEITDKIGIEPYYWDNGDTYYNWNLLLDDKFSFSIYDTSDGDFLSEDDVIEFHLGWKSDYYDEGKFPETLEVLELIEALEERDLNVDHSNIWYSFYGDKYNASNKEELLNA